MRERLPAICGCNLSAQLTAAGAAGVYMVASDRMLLQALQVTRIL